MTRRSIHRPLVPVLVLGSALVLAGCGDDEPEAAATSTAAVEDAEETASPEPEDIDEGTSGDRPAHEAAEVLEDPEAFEGEELTVAGVVDGVVSENFFLIAASDADQTPLGVLHTGGLTLEEGQDVEVSGTVRQSFEVGEAEAFLGGDFDDEAHEAWAGDTYIQAEDVEPLDG